MKKASPQAQNTRQTITQGTYIKLTVCVAAKIINTLLTLFLSTAHPSSQRPDQETLRNQFSRPAHHLPSDRTHTSHDLRGEGQTNPTVENSGPIRRVPQRAQSSPIPSKPSPHCTAKQLYADLPLITVPKHPRLRPTFPFSLSIRHEKE